MAAPYNLPPPYTPAPYDPPPSYTPAPSSFPPPQQQHSSNVTVMAQPAAVVASVPMAVHLREHPVHVTCPTGGHQVTTKLSYRSGTMTCMVAVLLLFFCPLAILPFFVNDFKDVVHTCPIDGTVIGVYKRI